MLLTVSLAYEHVQTCVQGKRHLVTEEREVTIPDFFSNPEGVEIDGNLEYLPDWNELKYEGQLKSYQNIYPYSALIAAFPMYNAGNGCGNDNTIYGNAYVFFSCMAGEDNIGTLNVLVLDDPNEGHEPILTSTDDMWFKVYEAYTPLSPDGKTDITSGNFISIGNGAQVINEENAQGWEGKAQIHGGNKIVANIHMNWLDSINGGGLTGGVDSVQGNSPGLSLVLPKCHNYPQLKGIIACPAGPMEGLQINVLVQTSENTYDLLATDTTDEIGSFSIDATELQENWEYTLEIRKDGIVEEFFRFNYHAGLDLTNRIAESITSLCSHLPCQDLKIKLYGGEAAVDSGPYTFLLYEAVECSSDDFKIIGVGENHYADIYGEVSHSFEELNPSKYYKYSIEAPDSFIIYSQGQPIGMNYESDCFQIDCADEQQQIQKQVEFPIQPMTQLLGTITCPSWSVGNVLQPEHDIVLDNTEQVLVTFKPDDSGSFSIDATNFVEGARYTLRIYTLGNYVLIPFTYSDGLDLTDIFKDSMLCERFEGSLLCPYGPLEGFSIKLNDITTGKILLVTSTDAEGRFSIPGIYFSLGYEYNLLIDDFFPIPFIFDPGFDLNVLLSNAEIGGTRLCPQEEKKISGKVSCPYSGPVEGLDIHIRLSRSRVLPIEVPHLTTDNLGFFSFDATDLEADLYILKIGFLVDIPFNYDGGSLELSDLINAKIGGTSLCPQEEKKISGKVSCPYSGPVEGLDIHIRLTGSRVLPIEVPHLTTDNLGFFSFDATDLEADSYILEIGLVNIPFNYDGGSLELSDLINNSELSFCDGCPSQGCPVGTDIVKNGNFETHPEFCVEDKCLYKWKDGIQDWSVEYGHLELQNWGHNEM